MVREIDGGSNYLGHNELAAHFGLGPSSQSIDLVTIRWPSGIIQELNDVPPNQIIEVVEPNRPLTAEELAAFSRDAQGGTQLSGKNRELLAGDADQDLDFDQLDLVQVQIAAKYLTGQAATWGEGDWNGVPGGSPGNPPAGDSLFNQFDIIAAQQGRRVCDRSLCGDSNGRATGGQSDVGHL